MDISVRVVNQELRLVTPFPSLISGTQNFIKFKFLFFDDDWIGLTTFAQFTQDGNSYNLYLDADNSLYLPPEIGEGVCTLMLYGSGTTTVDNINANDTIRATSNAVKIKIGKNMLVEDASSIELTQTLYDQLLATMKKMVGHPFAVSTASEMTDTGKIYIYTGSESGYTQGNWYYYNGSTWVSGGVYNAVEVETDKTLGVPDMPADSKKVGDSLNTIRTELQTHESNAINRFADIDTQIQAMQTALENVSIDPDDLGLEQDMDTFYVYPTYKGVRSENGIPLASGGGGGGGGGGDVISAVLTVTNTTGWLSKTIADGADCVVTLNWSSIEDEMSTGDGNVRIVVNEIVKSSYQISQGSISINLKPYLATGTNKVKIRISDVYDQGKTITYTITSILLSISSSFDASTTYSDVFTFPYTPVGAVEKNVYFILDGTQIGTQTTSVSGRQMSFTIPAQTHGAHSLRVYFEATINEEIVRSNELYYEFMFIDPTSNLPIITSSFNETSLPQYSTIVIPFSVYTPNSLTSNITISVNGSVVSTQTVDRTEQSYSYRADEYGTLSFVITCDIVSKTIPLTITKSDIDVKAETQDLALFLSSKGRSNQDVNPDRWTYGEGASEIACTFTGFNFTSDGWLPDKDGIPVLRVSGDARLTIPYKMFTNDFRATGKTIELEFATRNVLNYDAVILSCMNDGRGLEVTAQKATLKSEQSEISTQYKEDEHVRIAFVVEKRSENRLLYIYINGIASGVVQYAEFDNFSQITPVNISVGSSDCTIDLYNIRVYDNDLTRFQIVNNWIADTQVGTTMLERYIRNNVFDAYGNIVVNKLPSDLPYMIISCAGLPQSKGNDKKICSGSFVNPLYPSKSFTFENCLIDVQGTSSQYYARKNYKMKFNGGFTMTSTGSNVPKYAMNADSIPVKTFCMKADYASSEGANNVELVRLYESACPYKTPAQVENNKVRQGIDGFPILIFWNDTANSVTTFIGKNNC